MNRDEIINWLREVASVCEGDGVRYSVERCLEEIEARRSEVMVAEKNRPINGCFTFARAMTIEELTTTRGRWFTELETMRVSVSCPVCSAVFTTAIDDDGHGSVCCAACGFEEGHVALEGWTS